jgi:hypothetical protein
LGITIIVRVCDSFEHVMTSRNCSNNVNFSYIYFAFCGNVRSLCGCCVIIAQNSGRNISDHSARVRWSRLTQLTAVPLLCLCRCTATSFPFNRPTSPRSLQQLNCCLIQSHPKVTQPINPLLETISPLC